MARRQFTFGDEDTYVPSQMSPRTRRGFSFEENDERFNPVKPKIGFKPQEEEEEEEVDPYDQIISRYRNELGSEQPALAKYRTALQDTPRMQDYDLGKWGKVGAALAGFGAGYQDPVKGVAVAKSLREAPWRTALAQHDRDLEGLGTEAEFEQDDRKNRMAGIKLELEGLKDKRTAAETARLNNSLIDRRGVQNETDRTNAGYAGRRITMEEENTEADNIRADRIARVDALYKSGQLSISEKNAATARINAGTNAGRLGLDTKKFGHEQERDRVGDYQWGAELSQRDREIDNKLKTGNDSWVTPNVQRDAEDTVATTFYRDPMYRKFLIPDANGRIVINPDLDETVTNTPEYDAFELAMAGEVDKVINTKRGQGTGIYRRVP